MRPAMRRTLIAVALLCFPFPAIPQQPPTRPSIFGIAQVAILTTQPRAAQVFYARILRTMQPTNCKNCENIMNNPRYSVNHAQSLGVDRTQTAPRNLIEEITFATDDIPALRRYL